MSLPHYVLWKVHIFQSSFLTFTKLCYYNKPEFRKWAKQVKCICSKSDSFHASDHTKVKFVQYVECFLSFGSTFVR